MAFRKVDGKKNYVKFLDDDKNPIYEAGEVIVTGTYTGKRVPNKFNPDKPGFEIRGDDGETYVLPCAGHLAFLFESEDLVGGEFIRVSYNGYEVMESGNFKGRKGHSFILEIDDEKSSKTPVPSTGENDEKSADLEDDFEDDEDFN